MPKPRRLCETGAARHKGGGGRRHRDSRCKGRPRGASAQSSTPTQSAGPPCRSAAAGTSRPRSPDVVTAATATGLTRKEHPALVRHPPQMPFKSCRRLWLATSQGSLACRHYATETPNVVLPKHPPLSPNDESTSKSHSSTDATKMQGQDAPDAAVSGDSKSLNADLKEILASFRAPVRFAVGYGSGVFKQAGRSDKVIPFMMFY